LHKLAPFSPVSHCGLQADLTPALARWQSVTRPNPNPNPKHWPEHASHSCRA